MKRTLTRKQNTALDYLILDLDELDNKPRRLFNSLRLMAEEFTKNKPNHLEIIDSINEFEDRYYQTKHIPEIVKDILWIAGKTRREMLSQRNEKETAERYKDYTPKQIYAAGVKETLEKMSLKITTLLIETY
jgi:hypothetical protein